jgi:predicted outer membrane repeat protein
VEGGGIEAVALTLVNSTVSGNSASGRGGGILATKGSLLHATIAQNSAHIGGGVFSTGGTLEAFSIKNTIIAQNHIDAGGSGPDVSGALSSLGHNLIGIQDGSTGFSSADLLGTAASPLDPKLGPLKNTGGSTQTHALLKGSPAIDAGADDPLATLASPVTATDTFLSVNNARSFAPGMAVRLDREVVTVISVSMLKNKLTVVRGGPKKRAAHAVGAGLFTATDQRGLDRPKDGDGNGSRLADIGAFERQ